MWWHVGPDVLACWSWCVGMLVLAYLFVDPGFVHFQEEYLDLWVPCLPDSSLKTSSPFGPFWSKLTQFGSHLRQFKRHSNNLYNIWDQMWVILDNLECLVYVIFWSSFSVNFGWSMCVGMLVLMCWHVGPVVFICRSWLCSFCRRILCLTAH